MSIFSILLLTIALLGLLFFIDHKIKGSKSVILKVLSLAFFMLLIVGSVYLYGTSILESFQVDVRSFSKIKAFFCSRIVAWIILAIVVLFVLIKTIHVTFALFTSKGVPAKKEPKTTDLVSVVCDIDEIPNIDVFGAETNNFKEGLEVENLVFSFAFKQNRNFSWGR